MIVALNKNYLVVNLVKSLFAVSPSKFFLFSRYKVYKACPFKRVLQISEESSGVLGRNIEAVLLGDTGAGRQVLLI